MLHKLTEMEQNWVISPPSPPILPPSSPPPYGFIKNLQLIYLRESHLKFTGKKKSAIACGQNYLAWLVKNSKTVFNKLTWKISLSVSGDCQSYQLFILLNMMISLKGTLIRIWDDTEYRCFCSNKNDTLKILSS